MKKHVNFGPILWPTKKHTPNFLVLMSIFSPCDTHLNFEGVPLMLFNFPRVYQATQCESANGGRWSCKKLRCSNMVCLLT